MRFSKRRSAGSAARGPTAGRARPRRIILLAVLTAAVAASAAPVAQASSITVTAKPSAPRTQAVTVQVEADNPGDIWVASYDLGTTCDEELARGPASYQFDDNGGQFAPGHGGQVPQGSSTAQFTGTLGRAVVTSHVCAFLGTRDGSGYTTTVADSGPLTRWGAVAGFNVRAVVFYSSDNRGAYARKFRFNAYCSDGTSGQATDGPCLTSGRIQVTISEALRKQLHLKSRMILNHAFSFVDTIGGFDVHWPASLAVARALSTHWNSGHRTLPVTLTLITTAPLAKTVTSHGRLYTGFGAAVATYAVHDGGG